MVLWSILAAAAATAVRPGSQADQDIHCIAAFAIAGDTSKDEDAKNGMLMLMMYYIGKLDGEAPGVDLEQEIRNVAALPGYADKILPADINRCAKEMQSKGAELQAMGNALQGPN